MKQITQKLKSGKMQILEVPMPSLGEGQVLVRNFYSVVSVGTEGSTVKAARKGYIGKAKERPQQLKQVIDTLIHRFRPREISLRDFTGQADYTDCSNQLNEPGGGADL